jgi:hypothetical protein
MFVHYYLMMMKEQDLKIFVDMAMLMLFDVDVPVMNVVMVFEHNQQHLQEYVQHLLHHVY